MIFLYLLFKLCRLLARPNWTLGLTAFIRPALRLSPAIEARRAHSTCCRKRFSVWNVPSNRYALFVGGEMFTFPSSVSFPYGRRMECFPLTFRGPFQCLYFISYFFPCHSLMQDHKLKHMAELQLSVVSESESRRQIGAQIAAWEENLERLHCEQFRLRCYMASLQHGELPNPKVRQLNQAPSPYIPNFQGENSNNPNKKLNKSRMASVFSSRWTIPPPPLGLSVCLFFFCSPADSKVMCTQRKMNQ